MFQNSYFCAPNPQNQVYIYYQGVNLYPMNLIYAPTSPNYYFMSGFHEELTPQLFNKNIEQNGNHQNHNSKQQKSSAMQIQMVGEVKIEQKDQVEGKKGDENKSIEVKTEQIEFNQQSSFNKNDNMKTWKSERNELKIDFKPILRQEYGFSTRKETLQHSRPSRSFLWKQVEQETRFDGIEMIKEFSRELIIYILKNQDSKGEVLQSVKNDISQLMCKRLNKRKESIQQSLDQVTKVLSTKFSKFRKTKEEMIKYIFRKIFNAKNKPTQVTEQNWRIAQKIHKKNASTFKSMNMKFVEKQFQNPIFVQLFSIFLDNFHSNFEQENDERIDRLNFIVASAILSEDMSQLKAYKKLPWNKGVLKSIQKLFGDLRDVQKCTVSGQNTFEMLVQQFKDIQGGDSSLIKRKEPHFIKSSTDQSDF